MGTVNKSTAIYRCYVYDIYYTSIYCFLMLILAHDSDVILSLI